MTQNSDDNVAVTLEPVGNFCWPSMPTHDAVRGFIARAKLLFARDQIDAAYIADDAFQPATRGVLETVVAPPACGPVLREIDRRP